MKKKTKRRLDLKQMSFLEFDALEAMDLFVVGQEFAKKKAARGLANLNNFINRKMSESKPPLALLLVGPTGTGKTELIKAVADYIFQNEESYNRINLSLFHDISLSQQNIDAFGFLQHSTLIRLDREKKDENRLTAINEQIALIEKGIKENIEKLSSDEIEEREKEMTRLKGTKQDILKEFQGFNQSIKWEPGGKYPAIIEFEGIDNALSGVINAIKGILESGIYMSPNGELTNFQNCIIFLTCNRLPEELYREFFNDKKMGFETNTDKKTAGKEYEEMKRLIVKSLPQGLIKAIGKENIVVFRPLSENEMMAIIDGKLRKVSYICEKETDDRGRLTITFSKKLKRYIYEQTQDLVNRSLGAASVDRIIKSKIQERLFNAFREAKEHDITDGDTIEVTIEKGEVVFNKIEITEI